MISNSSAVWADNDISAWNSDSLINKPLSKITAKIKSYEKKRIFLNTSQIKSDKTRYSYIKKNKLNHRPSNSIDKSSKATHSYVKQNNLNHKPNHSIDMTKYDVEKNIFMKKRSISHLQKLMKSLEFYYNKTRDCEIPKKSAPSSKLLKKIEKPAPCLLPYIFQLNNRL
jgi:hypothetical protein